MKKIIIFFAVIAGLWFGYNKVIFDWQKKTFSKQIFADKIDKVLVEKDARKMFLLSGKKSWHNMISIWGRILSGINKKKVMDEHWKDFIR